MDKHDAERFFPESKAVRRRRLAAIVDGLATWVTSSAAVFTPMFGTAVAFGWIPLKLSLQVMLCAASFVLVVGGALAAMKLGKVFRRANRPSS